MESFSAARVAHSVSELHWDTVRSLISRDLSLVLQREGNVVEAVEQAVSAEVVDGELEVETLFVGETASVEINGELISALVGALKEVFNLVFGELDRQHAILEAVVVKNVGEGRSDDDAEAVVFDRPHRVLAAGAAAEVAAGEEDRRTLGLRLIQLKIGIRRLAVGLVAPIVEQKRPIAGALDALKELLGNDLISIDVGPVHGGDEAGVGGEGIHSAEFGVRIAKLEQTRGQAL